jgi:hypothetical protein
MSSAMQVTSSEPRTGSPAFVLSIVGIIGSLLLFLLILWLTYLPTRQGKVDATLRMEREAMLTSSKAAAIQSLSAYEKVPGTVETFRIPIEQAMELTVLEYQNR